MALRAVFFSNLARDKLIGAWHLERIEAPGPDGKLSSMPQPKSMLIYTRDGHMSVQLMCPKSANAQSNEYVQDGYEAPFGSYDVDETTHTLTHHYKDQLRATSSSARACRAFTSSPKTGALDHQISSADEHWSVTWEHY
jgi:hypothetical protein